MAFLNKLKKEGRLHITEPNEDVKNAYLERSEESLRSAKALFDIHNLKDSVALTYYSMYYSLLALLFRTGIKCETHSGAIILLEEVFNINNERISRAKKERIDKQYYVDFSVTKEEVSDIIKTANEFTEYMISFIDSLNSDRIEKYRDIAIKLMG